MKHKLVTDGVKEAPARQVETRDLHFAGRERLLFGRALVRSVGCCKHAAGGVQYGRFGCRRYLVTRNVLSAPYLTADRRDALWIKRTDIAHSRHVPPGPVSG